MGIFQFLWNFFFGSFEWIFAFVKEWFTQASMAGFSPTTSGIIDVSILMIIPMGSGLAAMTVAEIKERERFLHLFLGMALPIAYPILLYFVLPQFRIVSKEERELEEMVAHMQAKGTVPESELKSVASADKKGVALGFERVEELGQQYFSKIATNEYGNSNGPFILEFIDGRILEINRISAALNNALAVEIKQEGDVPSKNIRLPYNKISACHLKEEWLNDIDDGEEDDI